MNIYEITEGFLLLQQMFEDPEVDSQLIDDTMESLDYEFEEKADNYAKMIRNMEGNIATIENEQERLSAKKNLLKAGIKKLKTSLQDAMVATGKRKFKTDLFSFSVQKNGGKAPVVLDVDDTSELPDELVRIKEEADLDAIRALLEAEGSCKWAHLGDRGESLRIK